MAEEHIQKMIDGEIEKVAEAIMNLETLGGTRARESALKKAGLVPNGEELLTHLEYFAAPENTPIGFSGDNWFTQVQARSRIAISRAKARK